MSDKTTDVVVGGRPDWGLMLWDHEDHVCHEIENGDRDDA